jgi:hypothetical protein
MKKTVKIVTIPLNKSGKLAKKDTSDKYELAEGETVFVNGFGYTPQQLLVLSDDGIFPKDNLYGDGKLVVANNEWSGETNIEWKKVIASYPQLEGTLPISKETVQAWIDSGTPGEWVVNMNQYRYVCGPNDYSAYELPKDRVRNLLLEFGEKIINTLPYPELMKGISEYYKDVKIVEEKPSIPTDEEIKKKAAKNSSSYRAKAAAIISYTEGYKQALKDLGHE